MFQVVLFCIVAIVLVTALDGQVQLGSGNHLRDEPYLAAHSDGDTEEWHHEILPNPNTTDHFIFETVHSLLQHWPNTRMRNGHNIVPGTIPKGTLLYHGTHRYEFPHGPDWVSMDPEHSYLFCRDRFDDVQQGCWHLTLAATRPLKVVYFDGNSAAKLPYGSMDVQDLIAWGKIGAENQCEEWQLIRDLCEWGRGFGVDGFVRMEMDFEVMLCDFTSGVNVVSFANLVSRGIDHPLDPSFVTFEVLNAGSWHYHFPGETRVQLDLAGLISFYDTQLAPSLVTIRAGQERWDHRVQNISTDDLSALKSRLEAMLTRPTSSSSGIDWRTLIQVIVDRYSQRLELTRHFLNSSTTDPDEILNLMNKAQIQLRVMLTPYILFSAKPTDASNRADLNWTIPIYRLCATTHTYSMDSELDHMTDSEKLLLRAVRGTTREICRVATKMWATGVYAGIDPVLNREESPDIIEVIYLWNIWKEDLSRLMAWLDWNVWITCNPGCGPEEMCYLPTWPVGFPQRVPCQGPSPRYPGSPGSDPGVLHSKNLADPNFQGMVMDSIDETMWSSMGPKPIPGEWIRPQPRCIKRTVPYNG